MQLHQPQVLDELATHGARVMVISFAPLGELKEWVPYWQTTFLAREGNDSPTALARTRFAADPGLGVYHAYGMGRNSTLRVYGARILWQYVKWGIAGKEIRRSPQDPRQRGGDFVVGADRRVRLAHVGRDQADRAPVRALLDAIRGPRIR